MLIDHDALSVLIADVFAAAGCTRAEAERIAVALLDANLTGHDSHGVIRVPRYLGWLEVGEVVAGQTAEIVQDSPAFALLDGRYGFGQSIGHEAVKIGIEKAKRSGTAVVGLRHSGHLGRIGYWAEKAVAAGIASVHFVNVAGSQLVAPFGGVERRFSTAPFAVGLPMGDRAPIILDFATSLVAEGKVLVAAKGGKPVPEGSLIEPDGRLSADPVTLYGERQEEGQAWEKNGRGAIRAFGEHKGSGLALICELLAGALTGSGCSGPEQRRFCNGMLSIYMHPSAFGSEEAYLAEARRYADYVKSTRPAEAGGEVLLPGEPEARLKAERLANGVPLSDEVWRSLTQQAARLGVTPPAVRAAAS